MPAAQRPGERRAALRLERAPQLREQVVEEENALLALAFGELLARVVDEVVLELDAARIEALDEPAVGVEQGLAEVEEAVVRRRTRLAGVGDEEARREALEGREALVDCPS